MTGQGVMSECVERDACGNLERVTKLRAENADLRARLRVANREAKRAVVFDEPVARERLYAAIDMRRKNWRKAREEGR